METETEKREREAREFRETLARLRLRQSALAKELGVHPVTVSRWANGALPIPQYVVAYLRLYERLDGR